MDYLIRLSYYIIAKLLLQSNAFFHAFVTVSLLRLDNIYLILCNKILTNILYKNVLIYLKKQNSLLLFFLIKLK